jgi:hypothetical protein
MNPGATRDQRANGMLRAPDTCARFLNCPRCGLGIQPRRAWLATGYCPRCLARARIEVGLFSSTLPAAELYHPGSQPGEHERRTNTGEHSSRDGPYTTRSKSRSQRERPVPAGRSG